MNNILNTSKPITTIVFDMDGTVLNTLEDLTVSMNYVLERLGCLDTLLRSIVFSLEME